jgi:hypothetical protein
MKYLIGIAAVVIIIIAVSPTPSEAQKQGARMTWRQCAALAVERGERPGRPHYRRFIRECRRGLIPA